MTATTAVPVAHKDGGFNLRRFVTRNFRLLLAFAVLIVLLTLNAILSEGRLFTKQQITSLSNQSMTLTFAGMAQTSIVITGGIDLSVGPIVGLSNSIAATVFDAIKQSSPDGDVGVIAGIAVVLGVLLVGVVAGLINGLIVVYGRLQPIIVTLATASVYSGIALFIRPEPGGYAPRWYSDLLTTRTLEWIPNSFILLIVVIVFVWLPFRRSKWGLWAYSVGSNEGAAYMSGVNVNRAKIGAYVMGGLLASIAGLFLTAQTSSGTADSGAVYTLQSIATVVLGGTSLFGGSGGIAGTIAGAFSLRTINNVLLFARVNPLQQPLWEGIVILVAVGVGAARILTVKNRLDVMR